NRGASSSRRSESRTGSSRSTREDVEASSPSHKIKGARKQREDVATKSVNDHLNDR
ncbi:unnamed protein product, partial [Amoebophrya sp. A120]